MVELRRASQTDPASADRARISVSFDGAKSRGPVGVEQSLTSFNYLVGDRKRHRTNVPGFDKVRYAELYRGIDLFSWGERNGMKYEFHVAPGADWGKIHVSFGGSAGLSIAGDGSLHVATSLGDLVEATPLLYQMVNGARVAVAGRFVLIDADTYGFAVTGKYDSSRELVIDPDLSWSTYVGSSGSDIGNGIALDRLGNAYIAGFTDSGGWATAGAYDTTYNVSGDIFVAKVSASGSSLLYMTYLGGSGSDVGNGIKVDGAGNAYVTGYTQSSRWATAGAYDPSFNGIRDAFVAKLNPSGSALIYATYLGGAASDAANAIAIDSAGNAYVTGQTASGGWATAGAYQSLYNEGFDGFVAKINPSGGSLGYVTYLGGTGNDRAMRLRSMGWVMFM